MDTHEQPSALSRRFDAIARFSLLATVFILPFLLLPATWMPRPLAKMGFLALGVLVALIAWAIARFNEHRVSYANSNVLWTVVLLIGGYLVAAVLSSNVIHGLIGLGFERDTVLSVITFVAAFAAVALTTRTVRHFIQVQQAAFAAFLIVGIFQVVRIFVGGDVVLPGLFSADPTFTLMGSWNDLAVFSGLIVLGALSSLALFSSRLVVRIALYSALVIALILLALVNLGAVWVTLLFATVLLGIYIVVDASYDRETGRFVPRVPVVRLVPNFAVLLIGVVFLLGGTALSAKVSDTFNIAYVDVRPSWEGTMLVGRAVLKENAVTGIGPNAFREGWIAHKPLAVNETSFWDTDFNFGIGVIPTAFITGGLVVGALWVLFLLSFIYLGFKILATRIVQPAFMYIAISSYIGALYLWLLSIVYVPQIVMFAYTFMLTGAVLAAARIAGVVRTREVQAHTSYASGLALTGALLLIIGVSFGALVVHAERTATAAMLTQAIKAANAGDLDRADRIANSTKLFDSGVRAEQLKTNTGLARLSQILSTETADVEVQRELFREQLTKTITAAQATVEADRRNYRNWILLGDVYARLVPFNIEGAYENAVDAYKEAQKRNAKSPLIPVSLAQLALLKGDLEAARTYAREALALKTNYTDAYYLLSQIAIREGNIAQAIESTELAVVLRPNNTGLLFQLGILRYTEKQYQQAIPVLERAVALNPDYANALYFLGLSYDKVGDRDRALAAFTHVAELNPDNEEVQKVVEALQRGESAFTVLGEDTTEVDQGTGLPVSEVR